MRHRLLYLFLFSQIVGCAYIGTKVVLDIDGSDLWKSRHGEYVFIGNNIIVSIPEVVISEHGSAIGPVLPIIPLGDERSFESKQLVIHITITGFPRPDYYAPDIASINANSTGEPIALISRESSLVSQTTNNNKEGKLWVQYSFSCVFDSHLGDLEELSLSFVLPMFDEKVPELILSRRKASDNQFIISPGV